MPSLKDMLLSTLQPLSKNKYLRDALLGTPGQMQAMPTLSPEQQQLFSQLLGGLGGPMQQGMGFLGQLLGGDASAYEAPAMRQFQEQIIPGIAERFAGMGAGAQQSSAFGQQLGAAGAGLAENLAMQRAQLKQQGLSQLQGFFGQAMQPTFQWQQMPGTQGMLNPLMQGLGAAAGMAIPGAGGAMGSLLQRLMTGGR
jgi:hypothetical protein